MADVYCVTRVPTLFGNDLGQLKDARRHAPVSQPLVMRLVVDSVAVEVILAESTAQRLRNVRAEWIRWCAYQTSLSTQVPGRCLVRAPPGHLYLAVAWPLRG